MVCDIVHLLYEHCHLLVDQPLHPSFPKTKVPDSSFSRMTRGEEDDDVNEDVEEEDDGGEDVDVGDDKDEDEQQVT